MTDLTDDEVKALLGRFENPASRADANKAIETVVLNFPSFARALLDARAERDRAIEAVRQMHHAVCGETGFAAAVRADSGRAYPWPALDLAEEIALEVMRKDMGNV